jgi:serine/threonine protein kinase
MIGVLSIVNNMKAQENFYEDKDTKINLLQVKKIYPRVSYYATFSSDSLGEIHKLFSTTLNEKEISNIHHFLSLAKEKEFYNVEITAYMMLDDTKVELYKSKTYTKFAKNYSINPYLLDTLRIYGLDDFQYKSLLKIKDKTYTSKEKFLEDVVSYARIKRSDWSEKNIPILGLGEKGAKFMNGIEELDGENLLDNAAIAEIVKGLRSSYEKYIGIK